MSDIFVILPDQLFWTKEALQTILNDSVNCVYIMEDPFYFTYMRYHAGKIALHRASMQCYYQMLKKFTEVHYVPFAEIASAGSASDGKATSSTSAGGNWINYIERLTPLTVEMFHPNSMDIWGSLLFKSRFNGLPIKFHESPAFMLSYEYIREVFSYKTKLTFDIFYKHIRKEFFGQLNPRDSDGKYHPVGNQWTWGDNTSDLSDFIASQPSPHLIRTGEFARACAYIKNIPSIGNPYRWPINGKEALMYLDDFLQNKLTITRDVSTASVTANTVLAPAMISSSLGIGILTPKQILIKLFTIYKNRKAQPDMFESFFRKIMWREYTRAIYINMPTQFHTDIPNYFNATRQLPNTWYEGNTGIEPVDILITRILKTGYVPHTARLHWLYARMMIQHINPSDIYKWFMCMFIDSYPCFVIPNILLAYKQDLFGGSNPARPSKWMCQIVPSDLRQPWKDEWDAHYFSFVNCNMSKLRSGEPKMVEDWREKPMAERKKILSLIAPAKPKVKRCVKPKTKTQAKVYAKTPARVSVRTPIRTHAKASAKVPVRTHAKASAKVSARSSLKASARSSPKPKVKTPIKK